MKYILLVAVPNDDSAPFKAYQEIQGGTVARHCDRDGKTISLDDCTSLVLDANPPFPAWGAEDAPVEPTISKSELAEALASKDIVGKTVEEAVQIIMTKAEEKRQAKGG